MLSNIVAPISDALLAIPGVRFIVGLVDGALRPLWILALLCVAFFCVTRAGQLLSRGLASRFIVRRTPERDARSEKKDQTGRPAAKP